MRHHFASRRSVLVPLAAALTLDAGLSAAWADETAQARPLDPVRALRLSQAAVGRTIGDYRFTDQSGAPLQIASLRGRPILISYIYTSCGFVCPALTTRLKKVVTVARETLGKDSFTVLTVGFDARNDTPEQMRRYALERGISVPGWYFVSADQATVDRLAAEIGFVFVPAAGGFDHLAQVTIIDGDGRVYSQVYGPAFEPPLVVDPLKRLVLGKASGAHPVADLFDRVRLLCTAYDPRSGRYRFDYSLILEIAIGLLCSLAVMTFVIRAWRQTRGSPSDPW